jgi:hypothetical protein
MARTKRGEAEKKWRPHVEAWKSSGLSLRAYALREGLGVGNLAAWKRRLQSAGQSPTSFAPVVVEPSSARRSETMELVVGDAMVLRIPVDFDETTLARVVRALQGAR